VTVNAGCAVAARVLTFVVALRADGRWLMWQRCLLRSELKLSLQALNLHFDSCLEAPAVACAAATAAAEDVPMGLGWLLLASSYRSTAAEKEFKALEKQ
jgi:hypothetical protein